MTHHPIPQVTRRGLLMALGLASAAVPLAACGGPGGGSKAGGGKEKLPTGPVKGDISFAHWRAEDQKVFDQVIADFAKQHSGVTVKQDIAPSNDYQSTALQKIRSGNVGDAFVAFRGAQFVDMVKAGLYADLSDQDLVKRYNKNLIEPGSSDGKQYGLPYQLVFNMPVVNKDALDKAGVTELPKDWDGWLAMCDKLKTAGFAPLAWPGGEVANAGHLFNSMVMNNAPSDDMCAKIEKGEYKCTDDWYLQTLKQYEQMRPYFQPNSTGTAVEPAQQMFAQGKAAMLATGSFHIVAVRAQGAKFPVDLVSPITVSADKMKHEGIHNATFILGVNTASDNKATALAWLDFLSQSDPASTYANGTVQHLTLNDVKYTNPDLDATSPWLTKKTLLAPRFQFKDLDIRNAVEGACIEVVAGASPAQAAEKAQRIVQQRIG
ncbi:ABC transporter substrate-binding protein [Micromonospora sp. SL1-18]|uniref:ABC transporter substrate-binding protein n=1 Tax=Micromonospora sp. SL1-18 TaxID=3399128 RepID=UPI003A4E3185